MEEVVARGVIIGSSLMVREVILEGQTGELLGEEINFAQEQDLRGGFQYAKGRKERDNPRLKSWRTTMNYISSRRG